MYWAGAWGVWGRRPPAAGRGGRPVPSVPAEGELHRGESWCCRGVPNVLLHRGRGGIGGPASVSCFDPGFSHSFPPPPPPPGAFAREAPRDSGRAPERLRRVPAAAVCGLGAGADEARRLT